MRLIPLAGMDQNNASVGGFVNVFSVGARSPSDVRRVARNLNPLPFGPGEVIRPITPTLSRPQAIVVSTFYSSWIVVAAAPRGTL